MTTQGSLYRIVSGTASLIGHEYFEALVGLVADTFGVSGAFLAEYTTEERDRLRVVASTFTATAGPTEFDALRTPHDTIPRRDARCYPQNVAELFPHEGWLRDVRAQGYLAIRLTDTTGELLGELGVVDDKPLRDHASMEAVMRLISARASAELHRRRLEATLGQRDRRLRDFARNASDIFIRWSWSPGPVIEYVNPAWETITGYQRGELYANPDLLVSIVADECRDAVAEGEAMGLPFAETVRIIRKDGREVYLEGNPGPIVDREGTVTGVQLVLRDVTKRELEARVAAAEAEQFRNAAAALPEAVVMVEDGRLLYANPRAEALLRPYGSDLLAVRIEHPTEENTWIPFRDWIASAADGSGSARATVRLRPARGSTRWLHLAAVPLDVDHHSGTLVVASDVTAAVDRERELAKAAAVTHGVLSAVPLPIAVLDRDGVITSTNAAWSQLLGLDAAIQAPGIGESYIDACRSAAAEGVEDANSLGLGIVAVSNGSIDTFSGEYRGLWSTDDCWLSVTASPFGDGLGTVVIHSDISQLKLATETLSETASRQRWLLQHLPDQVLKISPDGTLLDTVRPTMGATPLRGEYPAGTHLRDVLPEAAAAALVEAASAAAVSNKTSTCRMRLPYDDSERIFETRLVPVSDGELIAIARDLSSEMSIRVDASTDAVTRARAAAGNRYGLTFRELAVLEAMTRGSADKEIASELSLSVFTVNKHVSNILRKMGALSRTEASTRTLREGLLS